jgi:AcrR family transcriptional regulator
MTRGRATNYDEQREMILAKAAHLFAQAGFLGTSMNQVAEASGLSKAAVYHYFTDKYTLLVEIAEGHVTRLEALVADVFSLKLAPDEQVRALIARIMAEYAGAQDAHRVLTSEVRFLEPADRKRVHAKEKRVVDGFARAVASWHPEHEKTALTKPLTMLLFGMINWMFTWVRPDGPLSHEKLAPIVTDLFFSGVPGVGAPPGGAVVKPVRNSVATRSRGTAKRAPVARSARTKQSAA